MGRILLSICAFVVAMGLGATSPPQRSIGQEGQSAKAESAQRPQPASSPEPVDAPKSGYPCHPGEDDRTSDLCAQWKAADASARAASWGASVGLATWIGVILGFGTLVAAALAAKYAGDAALATTRTLHNDRAWLFASDKSPERDILSGSEWRGARFDGERLSVSIVNTGSGPAFNIKMRADQTFTNGAALDDLRFDGDEWGYYGVAGKEMRPCRASIYLQDAAIGRLRRREARAFLFAEITYNDIFSSDERRTVFCFEVTHGGMVLDKDGNALNAWSFEPVERFTVAT